MFSFRLPWGWMEGRLFRVGSPVEPTIGTHDEGGGCLPPGTLVRCVMASGMGDVGVTTRLDAKTGYTHRAVPWQLEMVKDEEYTFESKVPDHLAKDKMFMECFGHQRVEWTPEVLQRSYWD